VEEWYLKELAALENAPRCNGALEGLKRLLESRGASATLGFFKNRGHDILEERLSACARSKEASIQNNAKEVLRLLHSKEK
jgi:hypothetical protein